MRSPYLLILALTAGAAGCQPKEDETPPTVTIVAPTAGSLIPTSVEYRWTSDDPEAEFLCSLDGAPVECAPDLSFGTTGLIAGTDVAFEVEATDDAGNSSIASITNEVSNGPSVEITLAPLLDGSVASTGEASFELVGTEFTNVSIECALTLGSNSQTTSPCVSPLAWSSLYHLAPVSLEVIATDIVSGIEGPSIIANAVVDARPPEAAIALPTGDDTGPIVQFEFDEVAPLDPAAVWTCEGPPGVFACAPGTPVDFDPLATGSYGITITSTDLFGNQQVQSVLWVVDADGPTIDITQEPLVDVCPTSDATTRYEFEVSSAIDPIEDHPPVTFICSLDDGGFEDCSIGGGTLGAFEWTSLSTGAHTLLIIGIDKFGNQGPVDESTAFGVGVPKSFFVIACP